uniref:Odorant-binding protein 3 n=1 Tax=Trichogramma dendrolimi TaxID=114056 RepID=A0A2S0BHY7_9HYME|nr:odorant-binding protein 3 [Trichogramma dendrolimi]
MRLSTTAMLLSVFFISYIAVESKKMNIEELKKMSKPMMNSCQKKTGVKTEELEAAEKGTFPTGNKPLMCYFRCLAVMFKLTDKDGNISLHHLLHQIDLLVIDEIAAGVNDMLQFCFEHTPKMDDSCEYIYELVICMHKRNTEMNFFEGSLLN